MADDSVQILRAVQSQQSVQALEQLELRATLLRAVVTKADTDFVDIAHTFSLDRKFRLVFVRCHFVGTSLTADFVLSVDSGRGSDYDTELFVIPGAGVGQDVHLRIGEGDIQEPSAWTLQADDKLRIDWTNPDPGNITWGLEVGMVLAS